MSVLSFLSYLSRFSITMTLNIFCIEFFISPMHYYKSIFIEILLYFSDFFAPLQVCALCGRTARTALATALGPWHPFLSFPLFSALLSYPVRIFSKFLQHLT